MTEPASRLTQSKSVIQEASIRREEEVIRSQPCLMRGRLAHLVASLPSPDARRELVGPDPHRAIESPVEPREERPPLRVAHEEVTQVMPRESGPAEDDVEPFLAEAAKPEVSRMSAERSGPHAGGPLEFRDRRSDVAARSASTRRSNAGFASAAAPRGGSRGGSTAHPCQ